MKALTLLDPLFRHYAEMIVDVCKELGVEPTVTSTKRTRKEQEALYADAAAGRSKYPAALPGTSLHEWGLAFDMELVPHDALYKLGPYFEGKGIIKWGGRFTKHDEIHFEANEAVKKAAGYRKGLPYEEGLEKVEPIGKAIETIITPWWSSFLPFDPVDWVNKNF